VATVQSIADSIVQIVRAYYAGSPGQAFDLLSQMLGQQSQHFGKLYTIPLKPEDLSNLYRLRVADAGEFGREQMFHIPFELRHKVATQRYSIPGFPSLYLGSSAYICWKELRCPQFDDVYSARLEAKSTVRVLNLGYRPRAVGWYARVQIQSGTNNQQLLEFLLAQVMFWPLLAAASVRVLHPDAPFKPEYIVPQLVLQFVREDRTNNIDGIRYFSLHLDQPTVSVSTELRLGSNFVFPVKTPAAVGLCALLRQQFAMTPVFPWQLVGRIHLPGTGGAPNDNIELVRGCPCSYIHTIFGEIEAMSLAMQASPI
jgi:hypothetical protein